MTTGKHPVCQNSEGTFVLKFVGDVRLTLCRALDAVYRERFFSVLTFNAIIIDLTEAEWNRSHLIGAVGQLSIPVKPESRVSAHIGPIRMT